MAMQRHWTVATKEVTILEPILKLKVNADNLPPDNNCTSEINKNEIIGRFLLKIDEQSTKTIEKRVDNLNNPTAGPKRV